MHFFLQEVREQMEAEKGKVEAAGRCADCMTKQLQHAAESVTRLVVRALLRRQLIAKEPKHILRHSRRSGCRGSLAALGTRLHPSAPVSSNV